MINQIEMLIQIRKVAKRKNPGGEVHDSISNSVGSGRGTTFWIHILTVHIIRFGLQT